MTIDNAYAADRLTLDPAHASDRLTLDALHNTFAQLQLWTTTLCQETAVIEQAYRGHGPSSARLLALLPPSTASTALDLTAFPQVVLEDVLAAEYTYQRTLASAIAHLEAQRAASVRRYAAGWKAWQLQHASTLPETDEPCDTPMDCADFDPTVETFSFPKPSRQQIASAPSE